MTEQRSSDVTGMECLNDGAYVLGVLSPSERQSYERHLATCSRCQSAVQQLAGLPGLLSLVRESDVMHEPELPPNLLPKLLNKVSGDRRRRRWITTGSLVLAAASVVLLVVVLLVRPTSSAPAQAVPQETVSFSAAQPGPMAITAALFDRQWGTSITVNCKYEEDHDAQIPYRLFVIDKANQSHDAGSWQSINGATSTVIAATSLHRTDIVGLEVRLPDGKVLLRASV